MGEVFAGRYELVDPVGRGGVGAVWRAWDHRRRRYVAAKVLQQSDAHALLRFVREQALRIDHPHVLAPASWAADDDKVLFTMDLVAGGSLVHLVGDYGPLPPSFVCALLDQLLSGLAAVHAEGVVHRDIKPANVLLEATGSARPRLRLSDFGIAMRLGEPRLTETDYVVGTPGYIAPEQLLGADPGFPADLFGVGLVALYLLEGARPDAKALIEYFAAHGTPPAPRGIPDPLWQVVAALLEPDPQARFRTATGARKALASAAELLPEPGPDDERVEVFDQLGPLPEGFGPEGPLGIASGVRGGPSPRPRHGSATPPLGRDTASSWPETGSPSDLGDLGSGGVRPRSTADAVRPNTAAHGVRPDTAPGAVRRDTTAPDAVRRDTGAPDAVPPQPSTMSDTGSFHLPPPQADATDGQRQPQPHPQRPPHEPLPQPAWIGAQSPPSPRYPPQYVPEQPPTPPGSPVVQQHVYAPTASYTTRSPQVQPRARRVAVRRPGPPTKVAVPVLLFALLSFAVGFWALARI